MANGLLDPSMYPRDGFVPTPQKGGGMFGNGFDWRTGIAAALAGLVANRNPQLSQSLMAPILYRQRQQYEEASQKRQNADLLQREKDLYQFKLDHPEAPQMGETERMIQELTTMPKDDPRRSYYESAIQHPVAMDVTNPDGSVTRQYVFPNTIPQKQPQKQPRVFNQLPPGAVPIGGQSPSGSGHFPF